MNKKQVLWHIEALEEYSEWQNQELKKANKITKLIKEILREGVLKGTGKPERLKYSGGYSRRIDQEHRLVYEVENDILVIISCKGHYED